MDRRDHDPAECLRRRQLLAAGLLRMTDTWQELLTVCLRGTERGEADADLVLRRAGELSLQRLAAWIPPQEAPPAWVPCPQDTHRIAPATSLADLLEDGDERLLREWLVLACNLDLVAPPSHLPALL